MKEIRIKFLPEKDMRLYGKDSFDVDDYYFDSDNLIIEIASDYLNDKEKFVLLLHAMIEAILLISNNIKIPNKNEDLDAFPIEFHLISESFERLLLSLLQLDWVSYEAKLSKYFDIYKQEKFFGYTNKISNGDSSIKKLFKSFVNFFKTTK